MAIYQLLQQKRKVFEVFGIFYKCNESVTSVVLFFHLNIYCKLHSGV